jgi:hypothetical protein
LLKRIVNDPGVLLRAPGAIYRDQIGDVSAISTPHPRLWVLMRAMGRFAKLRKLGVRLSKPVEPAAVERGHDTVFEATDADAVVHELKADGIAAGIDLPDDVTRAVREFAERTPFAVNRRGGDQVTLADVSNGSRPETLSLGEYENPAACPEIARLAKDPVLLDIAARYLGVPPRYLGTRLWWSFPKEASKAEQSASAQLFHFDLDDFGFLKFFFYITDVDGTAGPHVAVRGTHNRKRLAHQLVIRRLDDQEVAEAYGEDKIETICLPAGKGFAEDTFCLHKGTTPSGTPRLLLQLEYGVNDFHSGD